MTRVAWLVLLGVGCTDGTDTDDTGDTADDGCPEGMHAARDPGLFISDFLINGIDKSPLFDDAEYDGRPAGCIGDDGRSVDYLFLVASEPYGRVYMEAPRSDESYDLNGSTATVVIDLFGESGAPTFEAPEWTTGSWFVGSVGATFDSDLAAQALDDDSGSNSLVIQLSIEGRR